MAPGRERPRATLVLLVRHGQTPTTGKLLPGRAPGLSLSVRVERGLSDLDVGDWTGQSLARLGRRQEWPVVQRHPSGFRFPGGESFVEMQWRMTSTVARLVARHPKSIIAVVSHAG